MKMFSNTLDKYKNIMYNICAENNSTKLMERKANKKMYKKNTKRRSA